MTATVRWQWTLLLLNRENCALKFWVIEFVKVSILLYNTICRFSEGSNLGKGETFMKLPLADHLAHNDTQEGTGAVSYFTLLLAVVRLVQRRWKCCGRPQMILCYTDIKSFHIWSRLPSDPRDVTHLDLNRIHIQRKVHVQIWSVWYGKDTGKAPYRTLGTLQSFYM